MTNTQKCREAAKKIHPEYSDEWFNGIDFSAHREVSREEFKKLHEKADRERKRLAEIIERICFPEPAKVDGDDSSVGIYHLIDNGAILLPSDECLNDDCVTWWRLDSHPSGKHLIGNPHNVGFLCPMRRTGKRSPSEIEKILTK